MPAEREALIAGLLMRPSAWFCIALILLIPWQIYQVSRSPWFTLPPKPIGDGPDYENIAFHVYHGRGVATAWHDQEWRAPYENADDAVKQLVEREVGNSTTDVRAYSVQFARPAEPSPTTARPPLYPWIIAAIYSVLGRGPTSFAVVRLFSAICLASAGASAAWIAVRCILFVRRNLSGAVMAGTATIALALLDRTSRSYCTDFLTEPSAMLVTQMLVCMLIMGVTGEKCMGRSSAAQRVGPYYLSAVVGALAGALVLTRSIAVFWLPGLAMLLLLCSRQSAAQNDSGRFRKRAMMVCTMTLACLVVVSPWWVRNCIVLNKLMPLGTQGSITLLGGYCDAALRAGGEWQGSEEIAFRKELDESGRLEGLDPIEREIITATEAASRVREWTRKHSGQLPALFAERVITEWNPYTGKSLIWKLLMLSGAVVLFRFGAYRSGGVLVGLIAVNSITVMVLYSVGGRFLVPTYGIMYALAGIGVGSIGLLLSRKAPGLEKKASKDAIPPVS